MDDVEYMNLLLPLLKRILRKDDSAWSELLKMLRARGAAGLGIFPMHEQTSKLLNWTLVKDTRRLPTTKAGRLFAFIQVAYDQRKGGTVSKRSGKKVALRACFHSVCPSVKTSGMPCSFFLFTLSIFWRDRMLKP